jgi:hypothetical protein
VVLIWLCLLGTGIVATQAYVNLNFVIVDARSGGPVAGVTVTIDVDAGNGTVRQTDGGGFANFGVVPRTYGYTLTRAGYQAVTGTIAVTGDTTVHGVMSPNVSPNAFAATGSMTTPRAFHSATLLPDGRVLITGGMTTLTGNAVTDRAELYDPRRGTFTATGEEHGGRTATLLHSGQVLMAGGWIDATAYPATVATPELYDPTTGTFSATGAFAGKSNNSGYSTGGPSVSSASLLPDGRVLIAAEPTAELYDPASGTFSLTGAMTTPCTPGGGQPGYIGGRTATVLMNGTVLVAGGEHEDCGRFANAELYDARAGTFAATGAMTRVRDNHTATLLPDGTVLIAGGESEDCGRGCFRTTTNTESYVPSTGTFVPAGEMTAGRAGQSATLLNDGTVLIAGGYCYTGVGQLCGVFASAELYTPSVLVPAPALFSVSGDGRGQGAVLHAGTRLMALSRSAIFGEVATWDHPAVAGDVLELYGTGLGDGSSRLVPDVTIGGRRAEILFVGNASGLTRVNQVNVRVPCGVAPGPAVPVRLISLGRTSNEVIIGVR